MRQKLFKNMLDLPEIQVSCGKLVIFGNFSPQNVAKRILFRGNTVGKILEKN